MTLRLGFKPDVTDPNITNITFAGTGKAASLVGVNSTTEVLRGIAFRGQYGTAGASVRAMLYDSSDALVASGTLSGAIADVENRVDFSSPFTPADGATYRFALQADNIAIGLWQNLNLTQRRASIMDNVYTGGAPDPWVETSSTNMYDPYVYVYGDAPVTTPTFRKGSTLTVDKPGTLGTITTATLNAVNVFDHLTAQDATTATFAGAAADEITTSGEYSLVLGDGATTETITVQVNVVGVVPSNNPVQKDGAALASLTGVQVRVTDGANINGTEMYYSGTATTDASGNLANIDLSSTAAADSDPVLLHMRTAAGDSIIASETVGLI